MTPAGKVSALPAAFYMHSEAFCVPDFVVSLPKNLEK